MRLRAPFRPALLAPALLVTLAAAPLRAQERAGLRLESPDGASATVAAVEWHRGYAAVPASTLALLGWRLEGTAAGVRAIAGDEALELTVGDPFFRWGSDVLQLVDEPYRFGDAVWVPVQLLSDFLPLRMKGGYAFQASPPTLRTLASERWTPTAPTAAPRASTGAAPTVGSTPTADARRAPGSNAPGPAPAPGPRVVVIDAGHGGRDPGSVGQGGTQEKDVALAVALALAAELRRRPGLEVHLLRDDDRLVPIWKRGEIATRLKGDRTGLLVSLHTNAVASRGVARGFETYFLSDARTEHERRVAALENAPLRLESGGDTLAVDPGLDFILKELRNLDHQHWSALLAEMIQGHLAPIHPGPDRGVKQAPLAVITNALMPAVLVELGFITNREEERLLARPAFHRDAARALADAVMDFFERYPPGASTVTGRER